MSKIVRVKSSSFFEISSWIDAGAQFYVQHGEDDFNETWWRNYQRVSLQIFENKAITWLNNEDGCFYSHYEGNGVWAECKRSAYKIALSVDKYSFEKPQKPKRGLPSSLFFNVDDIVCCQTKYGGYIFVQLTSVSHDKGVVTGRLLKSLPLGKTQLNLFRDNNEHRFVSHGPSVCLKKVVKTPLFKGAPAEKCSLNQNGFYQRGL